jgi:hypothetical protein
MEGAACRAPPVVARVDLGLEVIVAQPVLVCLDPITGDERHRLVHDGDGRARAVVQATILDARGAAADHQHACAVDPVRAAVADVAVLELRAAVDPDARPGAARLADSGEADRLGQSADGSQGAVDVEVAIGGHLHRDAWLDREGAARGDATARLDAIGQPAALPDLGAGYLAILHHG